METHFPTLHGSQTGPATERVLADLRTLVTDAEALLRATADDASEKAREARVRLSAALEKAKYNYQELQAQGIQSVKAAATKADSTVRGHPYESVGIAFGVGILLGVVLGRR